MVLIASCKNPTQSRPDATGMTAIRVTYRKDCRGIPTAKPDRSERTIILTSPENPKRGEVGLDDATKC